MLNLPPDTPDWVRERLEAMHARGDFHNEEGLEKKAEEMATAFRQALGEIALARLDSGIDGLADEPQDEMPADGFLRRGSPTVPLEEFERVLTGNGPPGERALTLIRAILEPDDEDELERAVSTLEHLIVRADAYRKLCRVVLLRHDDPTRGNDEARSRLFGTLANLRSLGVLGAAAEVLPTVASIVGRARAWIDPEQALSVLQLTPGDEWEWEITHLSGNPAAIRPDIEPEVEDRIPLEPPQTSATDGPASGGAGRFDGGSFYRNRHRERIARAHQLADEAPPNAPAGLRELLVREAEGGRLLTHDDLRRHLLHDLGDAGAALADNVVD